MCPVVVTMEAGFSQIQSCYFYVYTQIRGKSMIIKHLLEYEVDTAYAQEQWLASTQHIIELNKCV